MPVWLVADMPFHNAFMISLFETGNFCAGLNTAVNSNILSLHSFHQYLIMPINIISEIVYILSSNKIIFLIIRMSSTADYK